VTSHVVAVILHQQQQLLSALAISVASPTTSIEPIDRFGCERRLNMNDDCVDDDDRISHRTVHPPAASDGLRLPPFDDAAHVPLDADQSGFEAAAAFGGNDYGFPGALATGTLPGDMYVVPFGLETGVTVGMPGYVPMDPTPSLFQSLPSISAIQSNKFYSQSAGKHHTAAGDLKDDQLFHMMTSSSSLSVPPPISDGYCQHYEMHEQQQDIRGYGEMTSMMAGQPAVVGGGGSCLARCLGMPEMLTGYAPTQPPPPPPVSVYIDGDGSVLQSCVAATARPSLDQFVNFDVDAAPAAALPSRSFHKPPSATPYSLISTAACEPRSTDTYGQHLQHHQLTQPHQPTSIQPQYRLPYPEQQPAHPPPQRKSPNPQPPRRDVISGAQQPEQETDEINTRAVAARVAAELKRYSVPQAVFAQLVLCRSQGTLSDLLRNPKPWSKLKSGRETFRRMWKWLQEPEYQRMSALRFAGRFAGENKKHSRIFV